MRCLAKMLAADQSNAKHKQFCPVTSWVRGGGSTDWVAMGQMTMCCVQKEPKAHKHFHLGTRPGGSAIRVTEKLSMCQMFMCLFRPLRIAHIFIEAICISQ